MQVISKIKKGFRLLFALLIFLVIAWVIPLKDKKGASIVDAFKKYWKNLIEKLIKYGLIKVVNLQ